MKFRKSFTVFAAQMMLAGSIAVSAMAIPGYAQEAKKNVSESEAKQIALEHAGFNERDVYFDRVETGNENGATVYEIEFSTSEKEYDYDVAIEDGEIVSCAWELIRVSANGSAVSEAKAKTIAVNDAGLTEKDVTFGRVTTDTEDGVKVYDIKFSTDAKDYDYDITVNGGKVESASWEVKVPASVAAKSAGKKGAATAKTGKDAAVDAALSHAGLSRDEVSRLKVENGHEDGRAVYEVEFHVGDYEYNYDIDAETYEVLDWDREIDD